MCNGNQALGQDSLSPLGNPVLPMIPEPSKHTVSCGEVESGLSSFGEPWVRETTRMRGVSCASRGDHVVKLQEHSERSRIGVFSCELGRGGVG